MVVLSGQVAVLGGIFLFLAIAGVVSCGDPNKDNFMGRFAKLIRVGLPQSCIQTLDSVGLGFVASSARNAFECCFLRRNPIVAIGYVVLVWGGFILFVIVGYPKFPNPYVAEWHKLAGMLVMGLCVVSFLLAAWSDPGIVTTANVDTYVEVYCNDGIVYKGGRLCETCKLEKPARSKHDRSLGKCVAKFDHYCIWLHNAVGERNYRWFMLFLASHTMMLLYGTWAVSMHFRHEIETKGLLTQKFRHKASGRVVEGSWGVVFRYFMYTEQELMMILVLCAVMGVVVFAFLVYHMYLASMNMTTNETIKLAVLDWHRQDAISRREKQLELRSEAGAQLIDAEDRLQQLEAAVGNDRAIGSSQGRIEQQVPHEQSDTATEGVEETSDVATAKQRLQGLRRVIDRLKCMLDSPLQRVPSRPYAMWAGTVSENWADVLWPRFWYTPRNPNLRHVGPCRSRAKGHSGADKSDSGQDSGREAGQVINAKSGSHAGSKPRRRRRKQQLLELHK